MTFARLTRLRPPALAALRRLSTSAAGAARAAPAESSTKRVAGAVFFSGIVGTTAYLGWWQIHRYQWKVDLVQQRAEIVGADPKPLAELLVAAELLRGDAAALDAAVKDGLEFGRVVCEGEFDHAKQILLGPRSPPPGVKLGGGPAGAAGTTGWDVVTPLRCADGTSVMVNRGWVPRDDVGALGQPAGVQSVHGVLKRGESPNKYAQNDPAARKYVWLDLPTMAASAGAAPLLVVAAARSFGQAPAKTKTKAWPMERPLESFLEFYTPPSTHLTYAATWCTLTVAGTFMTYKLFRRGPR